MIIIKKELAIKTIIKNLIDAKIIERENAEYIKRLFEQCTNKELTEVLIDSHMLNPLKLEQHTIDFISEN